MVSSASAQARVSGPAAVPVLMLSDVHFDPFRDPAKVPKLAAVPVEEWGVILASPETPGRAESYALLAVSCRMRGEDSDFGLLQSSLKAEKATVPNVRLVTIAGDLLAHQFDCRYRAAMKSDKGYAEFAEKTASFVIRSVEKEFPTAAVYTALGNNDSSCGDYKLDVADRFLAGTSKAVVEGWRGASDTEAKQAKVDYEAGGYYAVTLPGLARATRLLVVDDIFLSRGYGSCSGKTDNKGASAMMTWLSAQLDASRQRGEKVWVLGHIPPGVNVYSSLKKGNVCSAGADFFLTTVDKKTMASVLSSHADTISLALFGHTHMDEMKLIGSGEGTGVPMKGVASISPINGNRPSFTVAQIDRATGQMNDYAVYLAGSRDGGDAPWRKEYDFGSTYGQKSFSGKALADIAAGFHADGNGAAPASSAYERYFMAAFPISPLVLGWSQYTCSMDHMTEAGFKACACAAPEASPAQ